MPVPLVRVGKEEETSRIERSVEFVSQVSFCHPRNQSTEADRDLVTALRWPERSRLLSWPRAW